VIHEHSVQKVQLVCTYTYKLYTHTYTDLNTYINLLYSWKVCEYSVSTEKSERLN